MVAVIQGKDTVDLGTRAAHIREDIIVQDSLIEVDIANNLEDILKGDKIVEGILEVDKIVVDILEVGMAVEGILKVDKFIRGKEQVVE